MSGAATRRIRGRASSVGAQRTEDGRIEFTLVEADGDFTLVQWTAPPSARLRDGDVVAATGTTDPNGILHALGRSGVRVKRSPAWAWLVAPFLALAAHLAITEAAPRLADLPKLRATSPGASMYHDDALLRRAFPGDPSEFPELRNGSVLVTTERLASNRALLPILEQIARAGRPLLIVADDVEGETLATIVSSNLRGTFRIAAVGVVGDESRRRAILEDVAVRTGTRVLESPAAIEQVRIEELGRARSIILSPDVTAVWDGGGAPDAIDARAEVIRDSPSTSERDHEERRLLAMLGAFPAALYASAGRRVALALAVLALPAIVLAFVTRGGRGRVRVIVDAVGALAVVAATIAFTVASAPAGLPWLVLSLALIAWIVVSIVLVARRLWSRQ